ncbi:uncharacterized protein [Lepeophtheirus salmonis]|uniref:uncharacterized protein n=1 Tax=Lepeophtheirus salmonis TaxID=72036 RepID=UPI001AE36253|nr:uncharacterized protein LOC121124607 [Lepeophtheirus salmonis]
MIALVLFYIFMSSVSAQEVLQTTSPAPEYQFNKDFAFNLHSNLGDKIVNWNNGATSDVSASEPITAEGNGLFEFDNEVETPLGVLKGWIGDLTYPVVVGAFAVLTLYIIAQLAFQFMGFAFASKSALFTSFSEWFASTAVFQKLFTTYIENETPLDGRSARNLNSPYADRIVSMITRTLESIEAAKEKYEA